MITVFGLGFVGLTTALGFAHLGYKVYGVDVDETRKDVLRKGNLPFLEPEMQEVLQAQLGRNFFVEEEPEKAVADSDYVFYCVGTPYGENGRADLKYLFSALDATLPAGRDGRFRVLVTKSTIPPGTTKEEILPYVQAHAANPGCFGVANNPEFLREGHCWQDFMGADRIVLGVSDKRSKEMLTKLYRPMGVPIRCVTTNTGEFIKYLSNTMLATMISYANEMAHVADVIGDIETAEAFRILHMDKRWNGCAMTSYVYPGCGYGGYCLPKDTNALLARVTDKGYRPAILEQVIRTNDERPRIIAEKIGVGLPDKDAVIGILGLSFKPGSDDVRDTPAARIIRSLNEQGYRHIVAYDPVARDEFCHAYPELEVEMKDSMEEVGREAQTVAIVTAWEEFRKAKDWEGKRLVDCRYML